MKLTRHSSPLIQPLLARLRTWLRTRIPRTTGRWHVIIGALSCVGCASYGLGDAPAQPHTDDRDATSRFSVSTIAIDAHHDLDASSLTLTLIDRLEAHGLGPLRWGGARSATRALLSCKVSELTSDAFGQQLVVVATLSCDSSPQIAGASIEVHQRSSALLPEHLGSGTLQSAEQRLKLKTILGAIDQAAGPLSRALLDERDAKTAILKAP